MTEKCKCGECKIEDCKKRSIIEKLKEKVNELED